MSVKEYGIDRRLIEKAEKEESAQILEGSTPEGVETLIIIATGTTAGLLKKNWFHLVFPEYKKVNTDE